MSQNRLSFLLLHPRDVFSVSFDFPLPFLISPGYTFAIFPDATRRDATPRRIRFRTPNTLRFSRSLFTNFSILSVFTLLPVSCAHRSLFTIQRMRNVILRREYVTRGRAKGQTSNQVARRDGNLRADGERKDGKIFPNLTPNLPASYGFK